MIINRETIYECDICGKQSVWVLGQWITHVYLIGKDEPEFHLCSQECDYKLSNMSKNERAKLLRKINEKATDRDKSKRERLKDIKHEIDDLLNML